MKLWARVGMSIDLTSEEYIDFTNNPTTEKLQDFFSTGKAYLEGETYFPADIDDNPSKEIEL